LLQLNALHLQEIPGEEPVGELPQLTDEELKELNLTEVQFQMTLLEDKLKDSHLNLSVIQEYKQKVIIQTMAILVGHLQCGTSTSCALMQHFSVVCFLLVKSPASEFYMLTFWNTLSVPSS
jgi:hypothetical protein